MKTRLLYWLFALVFLVPVAVVWFGYWILWYALEKPDNLTEPMGLQYIIAAFPFFVWWLFALYKLRESNTVSKQHTLQVGAIVGVILTTSFWTLYYTDAYFYRISNATTGVNFGLAFLMLASPFLVLLGMAIGYKLSKRKFVT